MTDDTYTIALDRVAFPDKPATKQTRPVGDGQAAVALSWMNLSSERVPVPEPIETYDSRPLTSRFHRHTEACLSPVQGGPRASTGGTSEVDESGWSICRDSGKPVYIHDHGDGYASHMYGEWRSGCPEPGDLPW